MLKSLDQLEILRANELARISRWVRDSEHGWLFYDPRGRAHSISAGEAAELEAAMQRKLDRYIASLRFMPRRIIAAGLATGLYHAVVQAMVPDRLAWLAPAAFAPFIAYFLFEGSSGLRFWLAQRNWRNEQARRLQFRAAVPVEIETRHRRHNLFRIASGAFALAAVGHAAWCMATADPAEGLTMTTLLLAGIAWLLFLPANRVDATHRRRKWLA